MKVLVAIPVYDGKLAVQVTASLLNEKTVAHLMGDDLIVEFLPGCSHPAMGRNQLAKAFMESDCDRLFFLDADVTWAPGHLIKLCHYPVDFVGGSFRFKLKDESYPVGWLEKDLWSNELGLLEVASLPGGFLSLSRKVFEVLKTAHPHRSYEHLGKTCHCYFQMKFEGGHLCGEDSYFAKEWRDLGGKVYLDPEIALTHLDFNPTPYLGHIGDWLRSRIKENKNVQSSTNKPA